ncbi:unnamed protein product [Clonostachys chloroleuca]|uniref:Uncharacterized protein n=1 Tax=Clonostachys chloroleuca TaxID=1926264 RepID=A0AA35LYV3_9HYPO|nr:unnamed protein product [Clonostachys chloroleuca]
MATANGTAQAYQPYNFTTQNNPLGDNGPTSPSASLTSGATAKDSSTPPSVLEQSDTKPQQATLNPTSSSWVPNIGATNGQFTQPVTYAPGQCSVPMPQAGGMTAGPLPPPIAPMNNMNNMNNGSYYPSQHLFQRFNQGHNGIANGTATP